MTNAKKKKIDAERLLRGASKYVDFLESQGDKGSRRGAGYHPLSESFSIIPALPGYFLVTSGKPGLRGAEEENHTPIIAWRVHTSHSGLNRGYWDMVFPIAIKQPIGAKHDGNFDQCILTPGGQCISPGSVGHYSSLEEWRRVADTKNPLDEHNHVYSDEDVEYFSQHRDDFK